ncbi:MAG: hypothetical protein ACI90M_002356 [Candidatus Azotimanducaceae bacterium]|jgi:hypothetical protein
MCLLMERTLGVRITRQLSISGRVPPLARSGRCDDIYRWFPSPMPSQRRKAELPPNTPALAGVSAPNDE